MLPAAGQGAIGIEIRADDGRIEEICRLLNHFNTFQCVTAERAFLRAMGGGCQSPVAVCAEIERDVLAIRAISFHHKPPKSAKKREISEIRLNLVKKSQKFLNKNHINQKAIRNCNKSK
jgi:porphobilinogen deaminase